MFKHELDQLIYYLMDNRICSAPVLSRTIVENAHDDWDATSEQQKLFNPFGKSGVYYRTCHGVLKEKDTFASIEELKESM